MPLLTATEWLVPQNAANAFSKFFNHGTTDEACGVQNLVENGGEFLLHFDVRCYQIKKRNAVWILRIAHF